MFHRNHKILLNNSFFLFGSRGTGKTTLLKSLLPSHETLHIDLLDPETEDRIARNPSVLKSQFSEALQRKIKWVFIDEIQKIPRITDIVHSFIESSPLLFALTGSSARKLKREGTNLLAGRAFMNHLHPLTHLELRDRFDEKAAMEYGTLPKVITLEDDFSRKEYLRTYALTYVKEEIREEQVVRKLDPFRNFLEIAAQMNGEIVNYSNIARDVGSDPKTIQSYYQILEDTLIGYPLEPYGRSVRKRQRHNPKFYFFDAGVKRALDRTLGVELVPASADFGRAFEHLVIGEIRRMDDYRRNDWKFSYLRTRDNVEIDLIIERPGRPMALVEIKSTDRVDERHVAGLQRLARDLSPCECFCLSRDPVPYLLGAVRCLEWRVGLAAL